MSIESGNFQPEEDFGFPQEINSTEGEPVTNERPSQEEWKERHTSFSQDLKDAQSFEDIAAALQSYAQGGNEIMVLGQNGRWLTINPQPIIEALMNDPVSLEITPLYSRYDIDLADTFDRILKMNRDM